MARVLLHVCCGPCSLMPIQHLRGEGHEVTAFFFNPNIHPQDEYALRLDAMRQAAAMLDVPLLTQGAAVDPQSWVTALGMETAEGVRCRLCYRVRLKTTADMANSHGFDYFSSSLLYSRYQHHDSIIAEAEAAVSVDLVESLTSVESETPEEGVAPIASETYEALAKPADDTGSTGSAAFLYRDFRGYWQQGIDKSKEMGLYRQKWCACLLSKGDAEAQRAQRLRDKELRRLKQGNA